MLLDLTAIWSGFNFKIQFFSFNDFDSAVFFNNINVWSGSLHCLSKKRIIRRRKSESLFWAIFGSISFFLFFWQYLFFPIFLTQTKRAKKGKGHNSKEDYTEKRERINVPIRWRLGNNQLTLATIGLRGSAPRLSMFEHTLATSNFGTFSF